MIWHRLLVVAGLAGTAVAVTLRNKCFLEIIGNKEGRADCDRFLSTTTTLAVSGVTTVTVTASPITVVCTETRIVNVSTTKTTGVYDTITTYTSIIPTTPIQEAVTSDTIVATGTLTSYLSTTLATVYASRISAIFDKEDDAAKATGSVPPLRKLIPIYASDCANDAQYSFECRCAGATIGITTVPPSPGNATVQTTVTPTITDKVYVTRTNTVTAVDATSTHISTQLVGVVSFVSTTTFWATLETTVTTDIATTTGGTLTETTTLPPTLNPFVV